MLMMSMEEAAVAAELFFLVAEETTLSILRENHEKFIRQKI
jgi:hypothetical protein